MNAAIRAEQAADWFLRLREEASEEELREWTAWCAADSQNLREYERISAVWAAFDQLDPPADIEQPAVSIEGTRRFRGLYRSRAVAAALACLAVFAGGALVWQSGVLRPDKQVFSTYRAANRSATLPDGSTLTLAPRTNVAVDFSGAVRRLDLSYGEAYFDVRPDKDKPFVVKASGLEITAVGTAFNVKSEGRSVIVSVAEGVVAAADGETSWRVGAGHQIDYDLDRQTARIAAIDPQRELGWREGRLEYVDEPLATVIADANRYASRRIEIIDPQLNDLTYTGTIFTQALDDWLLAVESTFPVRVEVQDDRVMLRARAVQSRSGAARPGELAADHSSKRDEPSRR